MRGVRAMTRQAGRAFRASPYDPLVLAALTAAARRTRAAGSAAWSVKLHSQVAARAVVSGDWLVMEVEPSKCGLRHLSNEDWPVDLLRQNCALPGNLKFALADPSSRKVVCIRTEIPLSDCAGVSEPELSDHLVLQVRRSLDAMGAAQPFVKDRGEASEVSADGTPPAMQDLATLCKEAGWSSVQGTAEEVRITLDAERTGFRQAVLSVERNEVRVLLNLRDDLPETMAEVSQRAIALLLLRTGSVVRFVRPCISAADEEIGYEVRLSSSLRAADLGHALTALSLAARQSATEAEALAAAPRLASMYLASFDEHGS